MPTPCLLCSTSSQQPLCNACSEDLPLLGNACPRCAMPSPMNTLCGHCLNQPPEQDLSFSLFQYQEPVDRLIAAFKYHDKIFLSQLFATLMGQKLQNRKLPEILIPIPLHPRRLKSRGYNQSAELAKSLGQQLSIPVSNHLLIKTKDTEPQTSLPYAKRKRNINRAFGLQHAPMPSHIALVDDVLTTGHTANAAAKLFRTAGTTMIEVWTIARTMRHD